MEGDSVTLNSDTELKDDDDLIEWRFGTNGPLIAKINRELDEIFIPDGTDGRFRDRLKLDKKTRSLTIMNTRTTDSGLYEVTIRGSKTTFTVTVYAPDSTSTSNPTSGSSSHPTSGSSSHPTSGSLDPVSLKVLIPAAAAGSLLLIAVVVIFFIYRKHRKTDQRAETSEEEITYADPTFYKRNPPKTVRLCHLCYFQQSHLDMFSVSLCKCEWVCFPLFLFDFLFKIRWIRY
ncbi:hypothetical protein PO909_028431 [Leuciscus waleckii]